MFLDWIWDKTKKFIIDGIEITLDNNSFQFNNVNHIQTLGTTMGTQMAPTYAILNKAHFEDNPYKIIGKKITATT